MGYNEFFSLDIKDIEIIENALQHKLGRLCDNRLMLIQSTIKHESELDSVKEIDNDIKEINAVLGKLHNQKIWYRPRKTTYIGG